MDFEKQLEEAADRLGQAMKNATPAEKEILKELYASCKQVAGDQGKDEPPMDISAAFALAIIENESLATEELIEAAVNYINKDVELCRSHKKA